jgi:O-methyltransferase
MEIQGYLRRITRKLGFDFYVQRLNQIDEDIKDEEFKKIFYASNAHTMTSVYRMFALFNAARYISVNNIEGSFVECGVWKGGSSMCAALTFLRYDRSGKYRDFYMYDTYEGMPEPDKQDSALGLDTFKVWKSRQKADHNEWCYGALDIVKANLTSTKYPSEKINYVKGKVEDTIPGVLPGKIALLRLDTDFYSSTKHELKYLFDLVVKGGVIIIDDYGYWDGCRQAVNEYFGDDIHKFLLNRIDGTGAMFVK